MKTVIATAFLISGCLALPYPRPQQQQQFQQQQQQSGDFRLLPTFEETGRFFDDTGRSIDGFYRETAPTEVVQTTDHVGSSVNQAGQAVFEGGARLGEVVLLGMSDLFHGIGYEIDYLMTGPYGKKRRR